MAESVLPMLAAVIFGVLFVYWIRSLWSPAWDLLERALRLPPGAAWLTPEKHRILNLVIKKWMPALGLGYLTLMSLGVGISRIAN